MMTETIVIKAGELSLDDLKLIHAQPCRVILDPDCKKNVDAATAVVNEVIEKDLVVYGVNTGF